MSYTILAADRPTIDKDPEASLVYGIDVADIIEPGTTISGTPTVNATGVTVGAASVTGTIIRARCSAGPSAGTTAAVTFTWVTAAGDTDSRTIYLRGVQR